jgi:hypothetical protein
MAQIAVSRQWQDWVEAVFTQPRSIPEVLLGALGGSPNDRFREANPPACGHFQSFHHPKSMSVSRHTRRA